MVQSRGIPTTWWWSRLSLSVRFLLAASIVLLCAMTMLAGWVGERVERAAIEVAADAAAPHLQSVLASATLDAQFPTAISPPTTAGLDLVSAGMEANGSVVSVKLWTLDGRLLYSTRGGAGQTFVVEEVAKAAAGKVVASFEGLEHDESANERELAVPLMEIYVPISRPGETEVVAVGEIYQNAETLQGEILATQKSTWAIMGGTTLAILAVLWLIVHGGSRTIATQAAALESQVRAAEDLAASNRRLLLEADQARLDASRANEELLARIGADIHDGPVQLLSLLQLILPEDPPEAAGVQAPISIGKRAISELRTISAGLVLPEIESMSLAESLRLAVSRHEQMTGVVVQIDLGDLPEALPLAVRTCLYRVVQESLSNAFRHARGAATYVSAHATDTTIRLLVRDDGPGLDGTTREDPSSRLGLHAMRNRVEALRGTLTVSSAPGEGVTVSASIPIEVNKGLNG